MITRFDLQRQVVLKITQRFLLEWNELSLVRIHAQMPLRHVEIVADAEVLQTEEVNNDNLIKCFTCMQLFKYYTPGQFHAKVNINKKDF